MTTLPMRRSSPLDRRTCRKVGHDWGIWRSSGGSVLAVRDCDRCHTREVRHELTDTWRDKRWFMHRALSGRIVSWFA